MKYRFVIGALLLGITAAVAQVSTQLGTTTIFPNLVVENNLQAGSVTNVGTEKITGAQPQLTLGLTGGATGLLALLGTTSGGVNIFPNSTSTQLNVTAAIVDGVNGGTGGSVTLNGSTSGTATLTASATAGHLAAASSSVPTANGCTGFALATGSSDTSGRVTYTSSTTCTISFGTAFTNVPFCMVTPETAASTVRANTSASGMALTFGTAQTSFAYHCFGS